MIEPYYNNDENLFELELLIILTDLNIDSDLINF
jgi:hypothetical protein